MVVGKPTLFAVVALVLIFSAGVIQAENDDGDTMPEMPVRWHRAMFPGGSGQRCKYGAVEVYNQCGGKSAPEGKPKVDHQWYGHCCGYGRDGLYTTCQRQSEWYWQCLPIEKPSGRQHFKSGGCSHQVSTFKQCGGKAGPGTNGEDAAWGGYCCGSPQDECVRYDEWHWECKPKGGK